MSALDEIMQAYTSGDLEATLALIAQHEEAHGMEADFLSVKAMVAMSAGEYPTALNLLLAAQQRYPNDGDILCNLGFVYAQMGDHPSAYRHYRLARRFCRDLEVLREVDRLCLEYETRPDFEQAVNTFSTTPKIVVHTLEQLRETDFSLKADSLGHMATLMRRIEFHCDVAASGRALREGIENGVFTREDLIRYVNSSPCHREQLLTYVERML